MQNLKLAATKYTLAVDFDAESGALELAGSSYPENAVDFFQPLLDWVRGFIAEGARPLTVNFRLVYMNTSSTKCVLDLLEALEQHVKAGGEVRVNWYYEEDDEDIQEMGEELSEDIGLPFTLIPVAR
ncbi:MAG: DUF1987 domain-containing protein [Acidobacteria bacterium]|nr:DUF1987 domain-containing protein [Acidobacteriota bacterium]